MHQPSTRQSASRAPSVTLTAPFEMRIVPIAQSRLGERRGPVRADLALAPSRAERGAARGPTGLGASRAAAGASSVLPEEGHCGVVDFPGGVNVRWPIYVSEIEIGGKREDGGTIEADSLKAGGGAVRVLRKGRLPLTVTSLRGNC